MTNWAIIIKLAPVAAKLVRGIGLALQWLGKGLSKAADWLGELYTELESKGKEAK